jgi:hypothetical protein
MKEGLRISVLTTAASVWTSLAIGVQVGIGFCLAATLDRPDQLRPLVSTDAHAGTYPVKNNRVASVRLQ